MRARALATLLAVIVGSAYCGVFWAQVFQGDWRTAAAMFAGGVIVVLVGGAAIALLEWARR